jgi:hypothetical protein
MNSMRSVTTEIAMFVFSMPNNVKLAATAMAAIESAQCEPFHFASQFEHDAKYVETFMAVASSPSVPSRSRRSSEALRFDQPEVAVPVDRHHRDVIIW